MSIGSELSLGIDGGASSAKWSLINNSGELIKRGILPPVDGHLYRTESLDKFRNFLNSLKLELGELIPDVITLGITGFGAPDLIEVEILKTFPNAKINLSTDIALAYYSEFAPGEGIYIYAGTGSIAIHITSEGKEITVGGWGYLLGDEGAGYWIGREALRHLLLQLESSQSLDDLSTRIAKVVGGADWSAVRGFAYGNDRSAIAALAPQVSESAKMGVQSAQEILKSAASHLFELAQRMREILHKPELSMAFGGGLAEASIGIGDLLEKKLGITLKVDQREHSLTAAKLGLAKLEMGHDHS
jgi:glucosamine kinase